jgi:histidine phosphotransferase ChpT
MSTPLDAVSLASLLASRLCHDLINPVGALSAGLEVLEDEEDPEMRAEAQKLISLSTRKSIAMLSFCRLAFGAGGAYGNEIDIDEGKAVLIGLYEHVKADLEWQLPTQQIVPKEYLKAVLNIALVIGDCVPRAGSKVTISGDLNEVVFTAEGPRAKLKEELHKALTGHSSDLDPKMTPAFLAALLAHKAGGKIVPVLENEEKVVITATFPQHDEAS